MRPWCASIRRFAAALCAVTLLLSLGCRAPDRPSRVVPTSQDVPLSAVVDRLHAVRSGSATITGVDYVSVRYPPLEETETALLVHGAVEATGRPTVSVLAGACLYAPNGGQSCQAAATVTAHRIEFIYPLGDPEPDDAQVGTYVLDFRTPFGDRLIYLDMRRDLWSLEDGGVGTHVVDRRGDGSVYEGRSVGIVQWAWDKRDE